MTSSQTFKHRQQYSWSHFAAARVRLHRPFINPNLGISASERLRHAKGVFCILLPRSHMIEDEAILKLCINVHRASESVSTPLINCQALPTYLVDVPFGNFWSYPHWISYRYCNLNRSISLSRHLTTFLSRARSKILITIYTQAQMRVKCST